MGNPEHVAKLKEGVEAWNRWRKANPDVVPDLTHENLSNTEGSDFFDAQLEGANFVDAHLERANFWRAHLEGANFGRAHLERANFGNAHLEGANFGRAHLERANFGNAHLEEPIFVAAHLEEANFGEAHLERANFWRAHLEGADFGDAHLKEASFWDAHVERANFGNAHFEEASFREAHLERASFVGAHFEEADFGEAHLERASFVGAHLEGANFEGAHLEGANLRRAHLEGADFGDAHLKEASLWRAHLEGANLQGADQSNADLRGATGIRFDDTKILHARLTAQPGRFWQRWQPRFIHSPLTDPWTVLRRSYTGAKFAIALIALIALLLPLAVQATAWRSVNEAQGIMRSAVEALTPSLEEGLSELEARAASIRERAERVPLGDAAEWLAVPEWLLSAVTAVSKLEPCLAAECRSMSVLQLLLGCHRGPALAILTLCVLLYGGLRWYVTVTVSAYRDEEERSGYAPAWAPEPSYGRPAEPPSGWFAARLHVFEQRLKKHWKVPDLRRAAAGYQHLVWLHIFLNYFVLVVILAGFVNWGSVLFLRVELPLP